MSNVVVQQMMFGAAGLLIVLTRDGPRHAQTHQQQLSSMIKASTPGELFSPTLTTLRRR